MTRDTAGGYPPAVLRYAERTIADGDVGTVETLREMSRLARMDRAHPLVRDVAASCSQLANLQHPVTLCEAIRQWCAGAVTFRHDPPNMELLHSPEAMIRLWKQKGTIIGDCDDAAILAAGIALAAGCRARFVAVAFLDKQAPYRHVWAEIAPPTGTGEWVECDVTRNFQEVPVQFISRVLVVPVV